MVQEATADGTVKETILKGYTSALKELATAFHEESERAKKYGRIGRKLGITLGVIIMSIGIIPTIFPGTSSAQWLVGISAFFGLLVSINSFVMDPDKRRDQAEKSSTLAREALKLATDLNISLEKNKDNDAELESLINTYRMHESDLDERALQAKLTTNPNSVFVKHLTKEVD
ncbi:hypothetical protein [Vibrio alfacsensis]|uniref:hypothetical protein n=1 Tax=Vibrio alfacsensis TaxID=1074311 RepID=UPI004068E64B